MSKSVLLPIEKTVEDCLRANFSTSEALRFIVGVSGGIDSICLLHIFKKLDIEVTAIHINYQKRGEESDKDAEFVEHICRKWNLEYQISKVDPQEARGTNFQAWARYIRYQIFETASQKANADGIAVAHHQDDQIETILQKLFRGSGLANWSGMQVWDGKLFRPLLSRSRDEIVRYGEKQSLPFRMDQSNLKSNYARNFLRNEWLPAIEQHFPGWRKNVLRIAEQADIFASSLQYILDDITDEKDRMSRKAFLQLDISLQKSIILHYVHSIDDNPQISGHTLKEVDKVEQLQTGKSIRLTEELELLRDRKYLKLMVNTPEENVLHVFGKEDIEQKSLSFNKLNFKIEIFNDPDFERILYLDEASVAWPLRLRRWKAGDRFQPLGMEGHQTIADYLTNRKVSAAEKSKALILESFDETINAVIFPAIEKRVPPGTISEQVKCDDSTRQCLMIKPAS